MVVSHYLLSDSVDPYPQGIQADAQPLGELAPLPGPGFPAAAIVFDEKKTLLRARFSQATFHVIVIYLAGTLGLNHGNGRERWPTTHIFPVDPSCDAAAISARITMVLWRQLFPFGYDPIQSLVGQFLRARTSPAGKNLDEPAAEYLIPQAGLLPVGIEGLKEAVETHFRDIPLPAEDTGGGQGITDRELRHPCGRHIRTPTAPCPAGHGAARMRAWPTGIEEVMRIWRWFSDEMLRGMLAGGFSGTLSGQEAGDSRSGFPARQAGAERRRQTAACRR